MGKRVKRGGTRSDTDDGPQSCIPETYVVWLPSVTPVNLVFKIVIQTENLEKIGKLHTQHQNHSATISYKPLSLTIPYILFYRIEITSDTVFYLFHLAFFLVFSCHCILENMTLKAISILGA